MLLHLLLLFISPWISHPLKSLVQVNPLWLFLAHRDRKFQALLAMTNTYLASLLPLLGGQPQPLLIFKIFVSRFCLVANERGSGRPWLSGQWLQGGR